jgi:hypothetical protein
MPTRRRHDRGRRADRGRREDPTCRFANAPGSGNPDDAAGLDEQIEIAHPTEDPRFSSRIFDVKNETLRVDGEGID